MQFLVKIAVELKLRKVYNVTMIYGIQTHLRKILCLYGSFVLRLNLIDKFTLPQSIIHIWAWFGLHLGECVSSSTVCLAGDNSKTLLKQNTVQSITGDIIIVTSDDNNKNTLY